MQGCRLGGLPKAQSSQQTMTSRVSSGARMAHKYLTEVVPTIEPAAVEVPVSGTIAGVSVPGIADILTTDGMVVDVKTASSKPSGLAADHARQLATYELVPGASGRARIER
jgi:hypothetical protein